MSNLSSLLKSLPPIGGSPQGLVYEEQPGSEIYRTPQLESVSSLQEFQHQDFSHTLLQSSGLIQKVLVQKLRVLGSHITEIHQQIEQRRSLTLITLNHFDKCKMSLRNDELHLEGLTRSNSRDPNGLTKSVTTSQMMEFNRAIAIERQKAFVDEMKLFEERRRLLERYEQYKQSLELFSPSF